MSQRVDAREWVQYQWPYLLMWLGGPERVNKLAYETGAFVRKREFDSPSQILQLLMTWAVAERSLRETALLAAEAEMADVSNVALMKRFAASERWMGALLGNYLAGASEAYRALRIHLLDASSINRPGTKKNDLRLHLRLDLSRHTIDSVELTDAKGGETLERHQFEPGEVVIADRGYAHRPGLTHVANSGAYYIVRIPWNNVPLEHADGSAFDIPAALDTLQDAVADEFPVWFRSPQSEAVACRLVAIRKSEPAAEQARYRVSVERRKHGGAIDARTLMTAGYVFVLTNLPTHISADSVLQLYRFRWQIELKFKMLKSILHLGNVPARSEALARVYIMAKLLIALVIDDFIESAGSFSPWGYPLTTG